MKNTFKRIVSILLTVVLCISVAPTVIASFRGDVNHDGQTNSYDALMVLRYAVGAEDEEFDYTWADLNGDDNINSADALFILKIAVGSDKPENYNCEEILKFYEDSLYSTYFTTVKAEYAVKSSGYVEYMVDENDVAREPFESLVEETAVFDEDGYDSEGYTPYDYFTEPWIPAEAVTSATIMKKDNEYIVRINIIPETVTSEEPYALYTAPATGFYFDFGNPEYSETWGEDGYLELNSTVIVAHINEDGFVTSFYTEVPFAGGMNLTDGYDFLPTDISGLYTVDIDFYF